MRPLFATPQDAEDAFYDALEAHDLVAMMNVWANADDIVCIQPMTPIMRGTADVQTSWQHVFEYPERPDITVHHRQWQESGDLALHIVEQKVVVTGMPGAVPPIVATNAYRREDHSWHMVLHHVSPPPPPVPGQAGAPPPPKGSPNNNLPF